ncbi:hypothetical protein PsorP6_004032 [Peronosclerospora sorghi]|uniref:Uncharacterized protein n=1 Tax=Peronosclerospora sorghi TaxID=230839 RepID=A0ACC0VLB4_9STRA|nr:hypothetical protein PsorP6_004032 [Peronosclerospora sorghi]
MDRKAAEVAKQNKKPMTFNGVSYGLGDRDFCTKEQKRKELKRQSSRGDRSSSVLHFRIHSHVWANERKKSLSPVALDVARSA